GSGYVARPRWPTAAGIICWAVLSTPVFPTRRGRFARQNCRALFTPEHGWRVLALRPARLLIRSAWLASQAGHKAATLTQAMAKTDDANALAGLAQGLAALAPRGNDVPGTAACVERVPVGQGLTR